MDEVERVLGDLHIAIWEAGKMAEPLEGYPVEDRAQRNAFNYGKDCATADIEQAVEKIVRGALTQNRSLWRTIDTAPKDRRILATDKERDYYAVVKADGLEWEIVNELGTGLGIGFYPTHWMPLPDLSVETSR